MDKMRFSELAGMYASIKSRVAEGRAGRVTPRTLGCLGQYLMIAQRLGCKVCFEGASLVIYPIGAA